MNGVIIVNKERNMSSHDVVAKLRRIFKTKKVGHCGTLDPSATGVLVCLLNSATKLSNFMVLDTKEYVATFKLGVATTTQDLEGDTIDSKEYQNEYSRDDILKVINNFKGESKQKPSIYSAIKVNGKKLYEYARNNEEVEIPIRNVEIFSIDLLEYENDLITIKVKCSSGTYIRTLCYDIAKKLNYPGVLTNLVRTQSGAFKLEDSYTLKDIEDGESKIIDIKDAMSSYEKIEVNEKQVIDIKNGKLFCCSLDKPFLTIFKGDVIAIYDKSYNGQAKMLRGLW